MSTYTNYSKLEVDGTISSSVQGELIGTFTTMPKASALNEGKTIYYTGATSGNYVQNTFYTCVNNSGTYTWTSASPKQVSVDSALSATSTNPVQNKVITNALKGYAKKEDIASVYKAKGSIASANLPSSPSVGDVYDLTDASSYGPVGTNVVWNGTKWDALAGITDLSGKQDKLTAGTGISLGSNNTISLATSGVTAGTKGSATAVPVIAVDAYGRITSISTKTIYPPTSAGTSGQIWVSDGSGQGVWQSKDTTPTSGSTNAITSGAVYSELQKKQNNLTLDSAPTSGSSNPVTSGGVYTALAGKQATLTFDSAPKSASSNPVTSGGVYTALQAKQNKLTFDTTPTSGSNNPVTSGGIFSAINSVNSSISSLQSTVAGKQDALTFDSAPTSGSNNPVTSGGIFNAINTVSEGIAGKQDALTFDSTPTPGSSNPVTSDGIYRAISEIKNLPPGYRLYLTISDDTLSYVTGTSTRSGNVETKVYAVTFQTNVKEDYGATSAVGTMPINFLGKNQKEYASISKGSEYIPKMTTFYEYDFDSGTRLGNLVANSFRFDSNYSGTVSIKGIFMIQGVNGFCHPQQANSNIWGLYHTATITGSLVNNVFTFSSCSINSTTKLGVTSTSELIKMDGTSFTEVYYKVYGSIISISVS